MKKLFLFIATFGLLLSSSTQSHAQHHYIPIPEDSAFWISVKEDWHESDHTHHHTFSYMVNYTDGQDTIVNGKRYFGYYGQRPPENLYGNLPMAHEDWFRQDTIAKKVWKVDDKAAPDYHQFLLYDFSLQKGDTLTDTNLFYFARWQPYKFWVADVDSVYFPDSTWRYRWFIKGNFGPDWGRPLAEVVQIEGMGYTTDLRHDPLFNYEMLIGETYQITCFRHNSLWLYSAPNPWNADCDSMMARYPGDLGIHDPISNDLNLPLLYPNPIMPGGTLTLNSFAGKAWEMHTITAYNSLGQLVLSRQLKPGRSFVLPLLPASLYYFRLQNADGKIIYTQKISIL